MGRYDRLSYRVREKLAISRPNRGARGKLYPTDARREPIRGAIRADIYIFLLGESVIQIRAKLAHQTHTRNNLAMDIAKAAIAVIK